MFVDDFLLYLTPTHDSVWLCGTSKSIYLKLYSIIHLECHQNQVTLSTVPLSLLLFANILFYNSGIQFTGIKTKMVTWLPLLQPTDQPNILQCSSRFINVHHLCTGPLFPSLCLHFIDIWQLESSGSDGITDLLNSTGFLFRLKTDVSPNLKLTSATFGAFH